MNALLLRLALLLPLSGVAAEQGPPSEDNLAERLQHSLEAQEVTVDFRRPLEPEANRAPNQQSTPSRSQNAGN